MDVNFVELATYCRTEFRESLDSEKDEYCQTLFVAIKDDNSISISVTPHILSNASKCIMIHQYLSLAVKYMYPELKVQFINENGEVLVDRLDDEFELHGYKSYISSNELVLNLYAGDRLIYSCETPLKKNSIQSLWDLYVRLKQTATDSGLKLISSLLEKDQAILKLEKAKLHFEHKIQLIESEKEMYKGILDDIKNLLEQNK